MTVLNILFKNILINPVRELRIFYKKISLLSINHIQFLFFLFISLSIFSQSDQKNQKFIHITKSEGLSHNSITAIEKDNFGFIWVGTKNGLNRFDGENFKIFENVKGDTNSLYSNLIFSLEHDADGILWIGTDKGINSYNYKTGLVERLHHTTLKNVRYKKITSICTMKDSSVWFGSYKGLFILDKKTGKIDLFKSTNKRFNNGIILKIFQDSENTIWVGTTAGLYKANNNDPNDLRFSKIHEENTSLSNLDVNDIAEDGKGNIWIGTKKKGLLYYSKVASELIQKQDSSLPTSEIRTLHFDQNDNLWIGSFDGLSVLRKKGNTYLSKHLIEKGFKVGDGVSSIMFDDKIGLLIGGNFGGLKVWNKPFNSIKSIKSIKIDKEIDFGLVNTLCEDDMQYIYIGTKKNGIIVLDKDKNIKKDLTQILRNRFIGVTVKSIIFENGLLWIGTLEDGLLIFDPKKGEFLSNYINKKLEDLLKNTKIHSLSIAGNILAIGTFGKDLILYDTETGQMKHHRIGVNLRLVYFDRFKNLWLGGITGLKKIQSNEILIDNPNFQDIELKGKDSSKIYDILSIAENDKDQFFVGTQDSGFFIYNDGKFESSKLNLQSVQSIITENENLWLSTDKGIVRYNTFKNEASLYNQNYGLSNTDFRNQSYLKASNGTIYLGTTEGLVYFNPEQFMDKQNIASPNISGFTINGKESEYKEGILLNNIQSGENSVTLSYDEPSFTINFSSFDYHAILNNLYEYRLVGLHEDWKVTTEAQVNYVVQKPGNYSFQVRNKGILDNQEYNISEVKIKLLPAPWRSSLAIVLYAFIGVLSILGIYKLLKSKHKLEIENIKNTKEKEQFLSQIEFFTNLSHDFRTPLTLILAPLHEIIEQYRGENALFKRLLLVKKNADHLLHLINQILDFKKIDAEVPTLQVAEYNIIDSLQEVYTSFKELAHIGNYSFVFEKPTNELLLYYDSLVLERVIYNLLSNAFKNTPNGGRIEIILEETPKEVSISIKDDGKGIDLTFIDKIFERFYEVANDVNYKNQLLTGTGIGLHMAKKAIDSHDGKLEVESQKGIGSVFRIQLKKGASHLQKHIAKAPEKPVKTSNTLDLVVKSNLTNISTSSLPEVTDIMSKEYTILLVEDSDELRMFMVNTLKKEFEVEEAIDGYEGFSIALQKNIDLIVSDVIMPRLDGEQLCSKIKNDPRTKHIPFILLTSQLLDSQKISGLESGADAYISKPFVIKEFLLIVKNLLNTSHQIKEKFSIDDFDSFLKSKYNSEDQKLYKKAMEIVKKNMGNSSFETTTFSTALGISRNKLFQKIKEWTDKTPKEFIQLVRLKRASQLLEKGELTVSEICYTTGFSSPNYFATVFKKHYNMTPTEYADRFSSDH